MKPDSFWLLALIPLAPLAGATINLLFGRHWNKATVHTVALFSVFLSFLFVLFAALNGYFTDEGVGLIAGLYKAKGQGYDELTYTAWTWMEVDNLKVELAFRFDALTAVMCGLITFVGFFIHLYSVGYMSDEPRYSAYFGYLNLFMGAMLILVLGSNLPVLFIGWEGVGLCSYLLIGFWFENKENANAGRKAFVVNRIGDFCFILGMCLLFMAVGTLDFDALQTTANLDTLDNGADWFGGERLATAACILLFLGACGKSAQIPLYVWLPDAMAGPTPVSALIHAATMVTAGVYMIARLSFLFTASATAMAVVAGVGALTALVAAYMAFAQTDLKKVLAYSTVSQLGFMFVAVGTGAWAAGIFHLVAHGFFKAGLFLGAGSVMHAMSGSGDITKMGGLRKKLPHTHKTFLIYCLAIAGIFPFSGFFSKDEILAGAYAAHAPAWMAGYGYLLWTVLSVAAVGTAFYMFRLYGLVFLGKCRADEETKAHIHESPKSMTVPLWVLAISTIFLGIVGLPHLHMVHLPHYIYDFLGTVVANHDWQPGHSFSAGAVNPTDHHLADGQILGLMGFALLLGAVGSLVAVRIYKDGIPDWVKRTTDGATFYKLSREKFYVDEIYEKFIIGPFRSICRVLYEGADRVVIDTFVVGGSAFVVDSVGKAARWFQNGQVHRYLVMVIVGAGLVFYFGSKPSVDFDYKQKDGQMEFTADLGGGAGEHGAKIEWDFDGNGTADSTEKTVLVPFKNSKTVTLKVTDGVFGRSATVTKTVVVQKSKPDAVPKSKQKKGGAR